MNVIQDNLLKAFACGRPAQGYILVGPVRKEGRSLAEWIGRQLLGEGPTIADHSNPDMPWFEPEKKSRIIDVKMMRDRILPIAQQSALAGGWKVIVIVSAERMNEETANAFLKTLEEPPPQTLFLLLVDSISELLPTNVSRCQMILAGGKNQLDEPWRTQVLTELSEISEKSVTADAVRAEHLCTLIDEMTERAEKVVREESRANPFVEEDADTLQALVAAKAKAWRKDLLLTLEQWMGDLIRLKGTHGAPETPLTFTAYREVLTARANRYSLACLLENPVSLSSFELQLERNLSVAQILPYWMDRFYL
ncbi:MAG: hypothetical protein RR133_01465 [Kiritimatiellia bacterium]